MPPTNTLLSFAQSLYDSHGEYSLKDFRTRHFSQEILYEAIDGVALKSAGLFHVRDVGTSFEGRTIRLITVGHGPTPVLLWSQMHGDESTATMAIADTLNCILRTRSRAEIEQIISHLTIHFLPMLNPDGTARCQRRTSQRIDMNRDAIAFRTPEARILRDLHHSLLPIFVYNLHDQELSTVGTSRTLAAVALLAPAFDAESSDNDVRVRAKHLAATFAGAIHRFIPGGIARYDDEFEPRAFGDNMQKWGTSTLLVESGHAFNDPEKNLI